MTTRIGGLLVNPSLELWVDIRLRVRGEGGMRRLQGRVGQQLPVELVRALFDVAFAQPGATPPEIEPGHAALLAAQGVLLREDQLPEPARFHCALDADDRPMLVPYPAKLRAAPQPRAEGHVLRQGVHLQTGLELPAALIDKVGSLEGLSMERPILWVEDAVTGFPRPYWPSGEVAAALPGVLDGSVAATELSPKVFLRLSRAGVLGDPAELAASQRDFAARCEAHRRALEADEPVVFRGLLNPLQLGELRRYMRHLRDEGALVMGDGQVDQRRTRHNDPVARMLHPAVAALANRIVPEPVKPSYCFVGMYEPGAVLARHIDRAQSAWNLSLVFDTDPETDETNAWPINIEAAGQVHALRLGMGDAVLYRGTRHPHWRDAQPAGHRAIVCFYFFVPMSFDGPLD
jgi:hypothetical protein